MTQLNLFPKVVRQVRFIRTHNTLHMPQPAFDDLYHYDAWMQVNPCMDAVVWIPLGSTYSYEVSGEVLICGHDRPRGV